ncbi:MAG TPA: winged helix-turn-helix domain-containing protein [Thermoanaerobaculia bacterium]|nr:winged helix-turn-helix domain-containing protein [Thermoanaerobaculia bacterium]
MLPPTNAPAEILRFGPFTLDAGERELRREGELLPLTGKALETLAYLCANPRRLVTREELLAGVWPDTFVEEGNLSWAISTVRKALGPRAGGEWIQTVRGVGYRLQADIERVRRPPPAPRAIEADGVGPPAKTPERPATAPEAPPGARRSVRVALAGFAAMAVIAVVWLAWRRAGIPAPRQSIAVLGFRNLSGKADLDWLSVAIAEMVSADLAAGERLRSIPAEDVERAKADLSLPPLDSLSRQTLLRLREQLGADLVAAGSYLRTGGDDGALRIDLRLQDARSGEVLATASRSGAAGELIHLVNDAAGEVRGRVGLGPSEAAFSSSAMPALPKDPAAARLYAEGLQRLRLREYAAAAERLERALGVAPHFAPAHAALARARAALEDDRAEPEALAALRDSASLPAPERELLEARHLLSAHDWEKGLAALDNLWRRDPGDFELGLEVAEAQVHASLTAAAKLVLARLRGQAKSGAERARVDLLEWQAAKTGTPYKQLVEVARRAVASTSAIGAKTLAIEAYYDLAWSGYWANDDRALGEGLARGEELARELDDPLYHGLFIDLRGLRLFWDPKRGGEAPALFEQARSIFHQHRALVREAYSVSRLVEAANRDGDYGKAALLIGEMRSLCDEAQNDRCRAYSSQMRADVESTRGDLALARHFAGDALERFRRIGDRGGEGVTLTEVYWIADLQGDSDAAIAAVRAKLEIHRQLGDDTLVASDTNQLAQLLAENGRAKEAIPLATHGIGEAQRLKVAINEAAGRATLARALWESGRQAEALASSRAAMALLPAIKQAATTYFVRYNHALLLTAAGSPAEARSIADDLLQRSQAGHDTGGELECRFLLGKIEVASGQRSRGAARLQEVAAEAQAKGYGKVARSARSARAAAAG